MKKAPILLIFLVLTVALSCAAPEPSPKTILIDMTKEKVLKKFGTPDQHAKRLEFDPVVIDPIVSSDGTVLAEGSVSRIGPIPERFVYFNDDGSLVTVVVFNEFDRVSNVARMSTEQFNKPPPSGGLLEKLATGTY